MKTKVILAEDVKNLGKKYDLKEVAMGYARNFLIPNKLAVLATMTSIKNREAGLAKEQKIVEKLKATGEKIAKEKLEFCLKSGGRGEIFGSVTAGEIKKALADKGYQELEVILDRPLKSAGDHSVIINLGRGLKTQLTVTILT